MTTKQQQEALLYFKDHAKDWEARGLSSHHKEVSVIQQRNGFVIHVIRQREITKSALDVGCGTGDLVCEIARMGIDSTGVDFADEMIDIARAKAAKEELEYAHFYRSSIFDFDVRGREYDIVSANGFIEYLSPHELNRFIDLSYGILKPSGTFLLGSRNRLFNIFSINSFTSKEIDNGTVAGLLREAIALASGVGLTELPGMEPAPLQDSSSEHTYTGIDVSTRYQFTPVQLIRMLRARGLTVNGLCPIHIHGVPPSFKSQHPEVHVSISNLLHSYANDCLSLIPYASSFMLYAQKAPDNQL